MHLLTVLECLYDSGFLVFDSGSVDGNVLICPNQVILSRNYADEQADREEIAELVYLLGRHYLSFSKAVFHDDLTIYFSILAYFINESLRLISPTLSLPYVLETLYGACNTKYGFDSQRFFFSLSALVKRVGNVFHDNTLRYFDRSEYFRALFYQDNGGIDDYSNMGVKHIQGFHTMINQALVQLNTMEQYYDFEVWEKDR